MKKLLVICGPTAVGKTSIAIKIAKSVNGELVSTDSRQIYKGMDIGTGKDLPATARLNSKIFIKTNSHLLAPYLVNRINIWLYDIVNPDESFSAGHYCKLAWFVIKNIWEREKIPILVGGSGLYIKSVIDGIGTLGIPESKKLRQSLKKITLAQIQQKLIEIDYERFSNMNNSDKNNPRRIIRAIEVAVLSEGQKGKVKNAIPKKNHDFNIFRVGLNAPKEIIDKNIDDRVEKRLKQGLLDEVKNLIAKGYSWNLPSMSGLGYRQWNEYIQKKQPVEKVIQVWKKAEYDYARRQMTWFKKDKSIVWFDISDSGLLDKIIARINNS